MNAEMRRVLILPVPIKMLAETFQLGSLVRPPLWTNGLAKVITDMSNVKSPMNPVRLAPLVVLLSISEVVTGIRITPDGEGETLANGRATVIDRDGQVPSGALLGRGG